LIRRNGRPRRHWGEVFARYSTSTEALRFESPSTYHSKPSEISVGGSTTSSPAVTPFVWAFAMAAKNVSAAKLEAMVISRRQIMIACSVGVRGTAPE
jgi:hypothetical protein